MSVSKQILIVGFSFIHMFRFIPAILFYTLNLLQICVVSFLKFLLSGWVDFYFFFFLVVVNAALVIYWQGKYAIKLANKEAENIQI